MKKIFRKGAVGAMMDEYERVVVELFEILNQVNDEEFELTRDLQTQDEACRSIQTVVNHVVRAGYSYADYIRKSFATASERPEILMATKPESLAQIAAMMAYTEVTLDNKWQLPDEQMAAVVINASWGTTYDLEQLLEHAIVHVMRHRRQIERFLFDPEFHSKRVAN